MSIMSIDFHPMESQGVRSLSRGLRILEVFTSERPSWTVSQIADALDLPVASAHRLIATLASAGFLERDRPRGPWRLGLRLLHLGATVQSGLSLRAIARPRMEQLAIETGETVVLLVPGASAAVCIEHIDGTHPIRPASMAVGEHRPYNAGAVGLALLAFMPVEKRERMLDAALPKITESTLIDRDSIRECCLAIQTAGFAYSEGQVIPGTAALAAAIFGPNGVLLGVLGITGIEERFRGENRVSLEAAIRRAAADVTHRMGGDATQRDSNGGGTKGVDRVG